MEEKYGVLVIAYKPVEKGHRVAVLKRSKGWEGWELVKGGKKDGETVEEAAERETCEEIGIDPEKVKPIGEKVGWEYEKDEKKYRVEAEICVAKVSNDARISIEDNPHEEHSKGFFFNYRDAKGLLTYEEQEKALEKVWNRIEK
ncbi:MAG: NUDIX domain-containing protein [Candidatus Nanohaloarchaeota archaeon QJJ-9]|nr:NUDIX domain-containing protein [Candidatus Nanohaloarchaeota archaeon QJJ-9]